MPHKNELTLTAFIAKFNSEKACHEYLLKKRWPNGFVCPSCKGTHGWLLADGKYECSHMECSHMAKFVSPNKFRGQS